MTTDAPVPAAALPIPAPCSADWSAMATQRDDSQRFCSQCQHSVTNLSALPRDEAMKRLEQPGICVRYRVDPDENIVFATASTVEAVNRPIQTGRSKRSAVKRRLARLALIAAGVVSTPALANIPEVQASAVTTPPSETSDADAPTLLDRVWSWLGTIESDAGEVPHEGPEAEASVEPIPELSTEPGGIVPDPIERDEPRPIRMGRPAIRQPIAPASTQGQPTAAPRSPAAPTK